MTNLKRILLLIIIVVLALLVVNKFQDRGTVMVETNEKGVVFLDGIYKSKSPFCFTPNEGEEYNVALVIDNLRENIVVTKRGNVQISSSQGDDLGLSVKLVSKDNKSCLN